MPYNIKKIFIGYKARAGESGLTTGMLVHQKDLNAKAYKADADDSNVRPANAVIGKKDSADNFVQLIVVGILSGWSGLQEGLPVFLSTTAAGVTQSAPTAFAQQVGVAISSTDILFNLMDYTSHNFKHIRGGYDELDGDKLDIDWDPSEYTPDTTPTEVDNADHLVAHLAGINNALGQRTQIVLAQTFAGQTGKTVTLPTALADTSYAVAIISTTTPGNIGEISVETKATNTVVVKNSGSDVSATFDCIIRR